MLQRLELADRLAELLAILEIGHGAAEHLLAQPHHFGGDDATSDIEHIIQQRGALIDLAEHAIGGDLDLIEFDPRGVMGIDHHRALDRDALGLRIDHEQRQPVALAGAAGAARSHDHEVGDMAIDHEGLGAAEPETIAGAGRLQRGVQRPVLGTLVDGECCEQRAVRYLRQIMLPLRGIAAARQCRRREHAGGQERRRHQGAANLFHHHAGLDAAEAAAAEFLRHEQTGKAHLGERLPQLARESGCVLGVAQTTQMRDRRLVADQATRAVAQHRLFFGEDEGHGGFRS